MTEKQVDLINLTGEILALTAERDRHRADLETATAEIRTLREALKGAMDDNRYRAALRSLRRTAGRWAVDTARDGFLLTIDSALRTNRIDPSEFEETT